MVSGGVTLFSKRSPTDFPALLAIVLFWLLFCWPLWSGHSAAIYRDSAYLYWPLYGWIEQECAEQGLPLWNPYDEFGYSLLADATSALLYPVKIILKIPGLSFTHRFALYQALHIFLAALGGFYAARWMGARSVWSLMAGISYGFSGPVVFQATNVIYLVSAAWLPWAMGAIWRTLGKGQAAWGVAAGVFTALMVLGGDIQMAVVTIMLVAATVLAWGGYRILFRRRRMHFVWRLVCHGSLIALVAAGLSAVQWVATWRMVSASERMQDRSVPTIWRSGLVMEKPGNPSRHSSIWNTPISGTHHDAIYQFSQPPWTLWELLWPNVSGRLYPVHSRWIDAFPGAERMWHASLYQGITVSFFALVGLLHRWNSRSIWVIAWGSLAACASFGWYGLVWLLREMQVSIPEQIGNQVGGVYWFAVSIVPGFGAFRYPAKLFPLATLAIALLAALHGPKVVRGRCRSVLLLVIGFVLISLAFAQWFQLNGFQKSFDFDVHDICFGPLDVEVAKAQVTWAISVSSIFMLMLLWIIFGPSVKKIRDSASLVCFLAMLDIFSANSTLLPFVKQSVMEEIENELRVATRQQDACDWPMDATAVGAVRPEWADVGSENRLAEIVVWQAERLMPKFHLLARQHVRQSFGPVSNNTIQKFSENNNSGVGLSETSHGDWRKTFNASPFGTCLFRVKMSQSGKSDVFSAKQSGGETNHSDCEDGRRPGSGIAANLAATDQLLILAHRIDSHAIRVSVDASMRGILVIPQRYDTNWELEWDDHHEEAQKLKPLESGLFLSVELNGESGMLTLKPAPLINRIEFLVTIATVITVLILAMIAISQKLM